jgi:hypothetical protein
MTQAFNLSQLGNNINSSGQVSLTAGITGTLPIANGGTALTSAGTSGYVMTSNGSAFTMVAPSGGEYQYQLFAASGSWTCPTGVTRAKISIFGAGGGGSGSCGGGIGGFGGNGWNYFTVTPGTTYTVTIGTGGTGSNVGNGTAGGTSSFGALISATGGGGGLAAGSNGANGSCANNLTGSFNIQAPGTSAFLLGFNGYYRREGGSNSPLAWSNSTGVLPGGSGAEGAGIGGGGMNGAILLEYIG